MGEHNISQINRVNVMREAAIRRLQRFSGVKGTPLYPSQRKTIVGALAFVFQGV